MKTTITTMLAFLVALSPAAVFAQLPDDPFVEQWGYEDVGAYEAWDIAVGTEEVVVAVIDNGFDTFHPDLRDNAWKNEDEISGNGIDDDGNGYIDDVWGWNFITRDTNGDGVVDSTEALGNNNPRPRVSNLTNGQFLDGIFNHGTLVAGIIGAVGDNAKAGSGINWNVKLMNIKIVGNNGVGSLNDMAKAIRYAVDNGADVINISVVGGEPPADLAAAIDEAYEAGVVIVAAAGNDNAFLDAAPTYPVCSDAEDSVMKILGVSAIQENHTITQFSNFGSSCVDITAPGEDIASTIRYSPRDGLTELYDTGWSGTSFAAPFVSGAAALIKSLQPHWGADEVYEALTQTVHRTPPADPVAYEHFFGAGLLQIDNALAYVADILEEEGIALPSPSGSDVSRLLVYATDGSEQLQTLSFSPLSEQNNPALIGIDQLVSYTEDGEQYFATSRYVSEEGQVEINLFTDGWAFVRNWTVTASGPLEIAIADFDSTTTDLEVVLVPTYADDQVVQMTDLHGQFIREYSMSGVHSGASVTPVTNDAGETYAAILYDAGEGLVVAQFDGQLDAVTQVSLSYPADRAVLRSGDVDGDGAYEYVLGPRPGDAPQLGFYEQDGSQLRLFTTHGSSYLGGLDIAVADMNGDGADDVVVVPTAGGESVRVWSSKAKKLKQWTPFGDTAQLRVLVY